MMMQQNNLMQQLASQFGIDLAKLAKMQRLHDCVKAIVRQCLDIDEVVDDGDDLHITIRKIVTDDGSIAFYVSVNGIDLQVYANELVTQVNGNVANGNTNGNVTGKGKYGLLVDIAKQYGIDVSPTQAKAISWYAPQVIRKIVRQRPEAKNDEKLRQIAEEWLKDHPNRGESLQSLMLV